MTKYFCDECGNELDEAKTNDLGGCYESNKFFVILKSEKYAHMEGGIYVEKMLCESCFYGVLSVVEKVIPD